MCRLLEVPDVIYLVLTTASQAGHCCYPYSRDSREGGNEAQRRQGSRGRLRNEPWLSSSPSGLEGLTGLMPSSLCYYCAWHTSSLSH